MLSTPPSKKNELAGAVRALDAIGSRLLGIVITMLPTKGPDSYGYGTYAYGVSHDFEPAFDDPSRERSNRRGA